MKNGTFVFDAHTGVWDASAKNCKNRFGDAFIETFYAFQTGFNPPDKQWTMDYETVFRKTDPDWYLEEMFVKGDADMAILSTQVLYDFYHEGFVTADRNAAMVARAPERLIALGGVDPRMPNAPALNGTPLSGAASLAAGRPTTPRSSPLTRSAWNSALKTCTSTKGRPSSR